MHNAPAGEKSSTKPIRVLIADDHALIRAGTRDLLQSIPGIEIVGEAVDGMDALSLVATLPPQVLLIDVKMPRLNGLAVTERISQEFPHVRVIIALDKLEWSIVRQVFRISRPQISRDRESGERKTITEVV